MVREAFAADLLRAATLAPRVDQLDAIGVNDPEDGRSSEEDLRPIVMRFEEPKKPGALGEPGKQRAIVAGQPAIKRAVTATFERVEQSQGDDLTGPEVGLGVFGDSAQLLIDLVEQCRDKLNGDHTTLLSWQGCTPPSVEESSDDCKPKNLYH